MLNQCEKINNLLGLNKINADLYANLCVHSNITYKVKGMCFQVFTNQLYWKKKQRKAANMNI